MTPARQTAYIINLSLIQNTLIMVMMTVVMSVLVVMMMLSLLSRSKNAFHRITEFFNRSLENRL